MFHREPRSSAVDSGIWADEPVFAGRLRGPAHSPNEASVLDQKPRPGPNEPDGWFGELGRVKGLGRMGLTDPGRPDKCNSFSFKEIRQFPERSQERAFGREQTCTVDQRKPMVGSAVWVGYPISKSKSSRAKKIPPFPERSHVDFSGSASRSLRRPGALPLRWRGRVPRDAG